MTIPADEIWALIRAIESGEVTLSPHKEPQHVYAGNVCYRASNGWQVVVFNDCNEWDYFDSFKRPDGSEVDFDNLPEEIVNYRPTDEIAWKRYAIPGYLVFRCEICGEILSARSAPGTPLLCEKHLPLYAEAKEMMAEVKRLEEAGVPQDPEYTKEIDDIVARYGHNVRDAVNFAYARGGIVGCRSLGKTYREGFVPYVEHMEALKAALGQMTEAYDGLTKRLALELGNTMWAEASAELLAEARELLKK